MEMACGARWLVRHRCPSSPVIGQSGKPTGTAGGVLVRETLLRRGETLFGVRVTLFGVRETLFSPGETLASGAETFSAYV